MKHDPSCKKPIKYQCFGTFFLLFLERMFFNITQSITSTLVIEFSLTKTNLVKQNFRVAYMY
jgi:hypothetical protein